VASSVRFGYVLVSGWQHVCSRLDRLGWDARVRRLHQLVYAGCRAESWDVRAGQKDPESLPYALVKLKPEVVDVLAPMRHGFLRRLLIAAPQRKFALASVTSSV